MKLINRGKLQNFLADLKNFIDRQHLLIEEGNKINSSDLSRRLFIGAFNLLKREGIKTDYNFLRDNSKQAWFYWLTPKYGIGSDYIFDLNLLTATKYKDIPIKIKKLPKRIHDQKNFRIIISLIGETETFKNIKKIILTRKSTYVHKIVDRKLLKVSLNEEQKKGLLLILSCIRRNIKTENAFFKKIILRQKSDAMSKAIIES